MQIRTPGPLVHDGDFEVTLADSRDPAALIELDRCGEFQLAVESVADADRLIRAAVQAKRLLSPPVPGAGGDPDACQCGHAGYEHIYTRPSPCTQCGCKKYRAASPDEVAAAVIAQAVKDGTTVIVEDGS